MDKIVRIPVRVQPAPPDRSRAEAGWSRDVLANHGREEAKWPVEGSSVQAEPATRGSSEPIHPPEVQERKEHDEEVEWRNLALRLQAEMDNYRKRQQRLAQDQIESERARLLRSFLPAVDNLERALAAPAGTGPGLRQGVQLTYRGLLQQLEREGVERIQPRNQPFDPSWHEAVSAVPHDGRGIASGTVIEVLEPGYRLGDRLLRPARVIVAV